MNLLKRGKIWLNVIYSLLATYRGVESSILNAEDTTELLLKGKSLIRFGDGEFGIYRGKSIHYQSWSVALQDEFVRIKNDFENEGENCSYLLAVPRKYVQCSSLDLCKKRVLASSWAESRLFFKSNFNLSLVYGDAFLFEKANNEIYSQLWNHPSDKRTIIFVHNNPLYAELFRKKYERDLVYVQCPAKNAFAEIDKLLDHIHEVINNNNFSSTNVQLVISAGPAGKVLVYHLSKLGYSCIDAGHCWDDPLES